jgi:hypothetical protein
MQQLLAYSTNQGYSHFVTIDSPPRQLPDSPRTPWKGQVGMNDPSQSGPTFPFIAGMMNYLGGG